MKGNTRKFIEHNYKKLRMAQDLSMKAINIIGQRLMRRGSDGVYYMPEAEEIVKYINDLADKRLVNHYVLNGEYEQIILFDEDDLQESLDIMEVQAKKVTEVVKVQCYDKKVTPEDSIPIEISAIEDLFKLPKTLFNSGTCVYFLCHDGKVVYVGQAQNVHQRLVEHMRTKVFDSVFYIRVQGHKLNKIESALISYLKPKYNKSGLKESNKTIATAESILKKT